MIRDTKKQAQGCTVANAVHTNKLVLETMINWPKNLNSLQCNILSPKDSASKSNLIISVTPVTQSSFLWKPIGSSDIPLPYGQEHI